MFFDIFDLVIIGVIFSIVGYYAFLRYKEEKRKKQQQVIPNLRNHQEKFIKEREDYEKRANIYKEKMNQIKNELDSLKDNMKNYPWTESQIDYLKQMKGSEFEYFLSNVFEMLGFEVLDPEYYREFHIDKILKFENKGITEYIMIDYIDFTQIKKVDKNYLKELEKGKEKYGINKVWIITNGDFDGDKVEMIYSFDFNLLDLPYITKFLPSLNFFYEYEDLRSKFHATQILHKEMFDEIVRREHWLSEVEEKLVEATKKMDKLE